MHIFLVNDDGWHSDGILALARSASERGHSVTMVAPLTPQSGMSHRFSIRDPLFLKQYESPFPNCMSYSLSGSPADCVRVGLRYVCDRPADVLISGINNGLNSGSSCFYSGTFAAAREGAFQRVPSVAVSIDLGATDEMLRYLADLTVKTAERYASMPRERCDLLNINMPSIDPALLKEPVYAPLDTAFYDDGYVCFDTPRRGRCFFLDDKDTLEPCQVGSDNDYLHKGHVVFTVVGGYVSAPESSAGDLVKLAAQ